MSTYFEIAYAVASERLCLFTGTGFSKAITQNHAPGWQELLELCCKSEPEINHLLTTLFPSGKARPLSLDESAQVMDLELKKHDKSIHRVVAKLLQSIPLAGDNSTIQKFLQTNKITIATTNFDKLTELLVGHDKCSSIAPGLPIPRTSNHAEIFHVHGSIDSPLKMVITAEDYFNFLNHDSYFSKN